jgi:hypothetical protein
MQSVPITTDVVGSTPAQGTLCEKVCQWLAAGRWFPPGPLVSSTNKTDYHDITEILLKMALNTIKQNQSMSYQYLILMPYSVKCRLYDQKAYHSLHLTVSIELR